MKQPTTAPTVAIVGRMNVGKSTLFNCCTQSHHAITSSWAGTTRDINAGTVIWRGREFQFLDTGGLDVEDDEQLEERVIAAARNAIAQADLVLFLIDGQAGVLPQDKRLAKELRDLDIPVFLVVNKIDSTKREHAIPNEVYQLNIEPLFVISAVNGRGTGDLLDGIYDVLQPTTSAATPEERTKVAIVGRPNVGKSSLLNAILGEERVIVADQAHTTRDTNDIPYEYNGKKFLLIDTAGIRKRSRVGKRWPDKRIGQIEKQSVQSAIDAMQRADVVLLVLEAQKRITAQDKKIADLANEFGKGLILVVNKWDLIDEKETNTINEFSSYFDASLPFLRWAPMIFVSAQEKLRVKNTLDMVLRVADNFNRFLETEDLETVLAIARSSYRPRKTATRKYRKPHISMKRLKQVSARPPRFYLKTTRPKDMPRAIPRIVEKEIRERFDFEGVKIIIDIGT